MRPVVFSLLLAGYGCVAPGATASADPVGDPLPRVAITDGRFTVMDDASIVRSRPLHADSYDRGATDGSVSVQFPLASPDCTGVHAEVHETADAVAVELHEGVHPSAVGRMCTMIVVPATLNVRLQDPLGARIVLSTF